MYKKILLLLVLLLAAEFISIGILWSKFKPYEPKPLTKLDVLASKKVLSQIYTGLKLPEKLVLNTPEKIWEIDQNILKSWLAYSPSKSLKKPHHSLHDYFTAQINPSSFWTNPDNPATLQSQLIKEDLVGSYLLNLATEINREAVDAKLEIENDRAKIFVPDETGQILDLGRTRTELKLALAESKTGLKLPVHTVEPKIKLGQLNSLGIRELVGRGQSDFTGSSNSRINNIKTGAAKYQGIIVKAGEEFSFNKYLGPIDSEHGYLPELVIKPEGATPEFGGGLCQVSTTAFRGAFFSGLPITARRNHSYAVRYYEWIDDDSPRVPGLDATIYVGAQDMKFVNDTPGAILIWTYTKGKRLYFDFYGTRDGREVVMDGPHAYDKKPSGAVKAKVTRKVIRPGSPPVEVTFQSSYVPPKTLPQTFELPGASPNLPSNQPLLPTNQ